MELDHPNILECVDYDLEGKPYLVTEYYEEGALRDADLDSWETLERLRLFSSVCEAVGHAHSHGVIHRDLKPGNIFLKADGETPVVGDFGICFLGEDGERFTETGEAVGPQYYAAPELEDSRAQDVTPAADVYSLGKLLYYLFEGDVFAREKHRSANWSLTASHRDLTSTELWERSFVNELLDKSIARDPADRFNNAYQFGAHADKAIWRIERGGNVTDFRETQICSFCGNGTYQPVVNTEEAELDGMPYTGEAHRFNIEQYDGNEWIALWCNYCGNVQHFRTDILKRGDWKGEGEIDWGP